MFYEPDKEREMRQYLTLCIDAYVEYIFLYSNIISVTLGKKVSATTQETRHRRLSVSVVTHSRSGGGHTAAVARSP